MIQIGVFAREAQLCDALRNGFVLFDAMLAPQGANSVALALGLGAGTSLAEGLGLFATDPALHEELGAMLTCSLESGDTGSRPGVQLTVRGELREFALTTMRLEEDDGTGFAALIVTETTDRLQLRTQFNRILDSSPDGIFVIDPDRRVQMSNRALAELTGVEPGTLLKQGCSCGEAIQCHSESGESYATSLCPAKSLFKGESQHSREEMLLTNAAGEERWIETTYSPLKNERGEVEYVIGILRDVHERKALEERLHQTEKLASLGQLVAGIAHEIKNPLAIITSSLDVIENGDRSAADRAEAGRFARDEVHRIDERVRAFLAFARPRALAPRPMLLSGLVERRLSALRTLYPQVEFKLAVVPPDPVAMADEEQILQVFTNLVLNAAEAMNGEGRVTIRTRQQGNWSVLEVEDTGPGIKPTIVSRIFDPFFTTKCNGTGLGLSVCYQIVLAHRGTIGVSPGCGGVGTCFSVRLPVAGRVEG